MPDSKTFAARLNQALDELPLEFRPPAKGEGRQAFVARMFRVSQKGARKWLEGEALPRTSRLSQIARRCGVSGEWLLTGQGEMRIEPSARRVAETPSRYETPSSRGRRLVALISEAEIDGRLRQQDVAAIEHLVLRLVELRH